MIERFLKWWLPFWYGDPCPHGNYGRRYNDKPAILSCRECHREWVEENKAYRCPCCDCQRTAR